MKKAIAVLLMMILSVTMMTSCSPDRSVLSTAISCIQSEDHAERLHTYDSPYTVGYRNKDNTYSLYIFSSPVQYKTETEGYQVIDNTVVASNRAGCAFENKANNIKTYFPKTLTGSFRVEKKGDFIEFKPDLDTEGFSEAKKTIFINMYGDRVSAVVYSRSDMELAFYPTKAGIKSEIIVKEQNEKNSDIQFTVRSNAADFENKQNGYILLKAGGEKKALLYQPLVQYTADAGQQLDVTTQMDIQKEGGESLVTLEINHEILNNPELKYPIKLDPSFEMYLNKIPDTSVYSKFNTNSYLRNYAVVGEHPVLGQGWEYTRFRLNWFTYTQDDNIKSVYYYAKTLYDPLNSNINAFLPNYQWSSTNMNWNTKIFPNDQKYFSSSIVGSQLKLNIIEYTKMCFLDPEWESESRGLILKVEKQKYVILTTSDNSMYSSYVEMRLYQLPNYFEQKLNINPT